MKIIKRQYGNPQYNFTMWLIPTLSYIGLKLSGLLNPSKEWVWWVAIPVMFSIWVMLNWKIKK
jgi:hypothetical protein